MKNLLKGSQSETVREIQKVTVAIPNSLQENDLWKCINSWKRNWNSHMVAGGNYFKGDHCGSKLNLMQCCLWVQSLYLIIRQLT
jgi:hypothetical protein